VEGSEEAQREVTQKVLQAYCFKSGEQFVELVNAMTGAQIVVLLDDLEKLSRAATGCARAIRESFFAGGV
jgi:hypothetical protein